MYQKLPGACGDGGGGSLSLWDAHPGAYLTGYRGTDCGPYDHVFTSDGDWILIAWDTTLHINYFDDLIEQNVEADASRSTGLFYRTNNSQHITQVTFSPDEEFLAIHRDLYWFARDIANPPEPKIDLFRFEDILETGGSAVEDHVIASIPGATEALFSPDSQWLLTDNGFWNAQTGEQLAGISGTIASFSPDGSLLAIYESGQVHLWEVGALLNDSHASIGHDRCRGCRRTRLQP